MKHLYSLLFLLAIGGNVLAQRNADLELETSISNPDTFFFNSVSNGGAKTGHIVTFKITNHGPDKVLQTDTIKMSLNYNGYPTPTSIGKKTFSLYFNSNVPGINAGDSAFYVDTFYFSAAYGASPYLWCDSIWGKAQGGSPSWNDANVFPNKACKSIRFQQDPAFVEEISTASGKAFNVYPNPASTMLNFAFDFGFSPVTASISVRDILGKTIRSQQLGEDLSGKKTYGIDVSDCSSGLYFVELRVNDTKHIAKVNILR